MNWGVNLSKKQQACSWAIRSWWVLFLQIRFYLCLSRLCSQSRFYVYQKCFSFLCLTSARALQVLHSPGLLSQRSPALGGRPALSSMSSLAKGWTGHEIGRRPRWLQASQNSCFFTLTKRNQSICWLFYLSHRYGCWDQDGLNGLSTWVTQDRSCIRTQAHVGIPWRSRA